MVTNTAANGTGGIVYKLTLAPVPEPATLILAFTAFVFAAWPRRFAAIEIVHRLAVPATGVWPCATRQLLRITIFGSRRPTFGLASPRDVCVALPARCVRRHPSRCAPTPAARPSRRGKFCGRRGPSCRHELRHGYRPTDPSPLLRTRHISMPGHPIDARAMSRMLSITCSGKRGIHDFAPRLSRNNRTPLNAITPAAKRAAQSSAGS